MRTYLFILLMLITLNLPAIDFERGMVAYERGDYAAALQPLMQLAEAGDPDAQFMLGRMFAGGAGVVQDFIEGYKWYNLAASRGQRMAPAARDALAERMSPEQIAAAQSLARDWRPLGRLPAPPPAPPPAVAPMEPGPPIEVPSLPETDPVENSSESTIALIQLELKRLGYTIGAIDGQLGPQTRSAIRAFQADQALVVDGEPSAALLRQLSATQGDRPAIRRAPADGAGESDNWRRLM